MYETLSSDIDKLEWIRWSKEFYASHQLAVENSTSQDVVLVSADGIRFQSHRLILSSSSNFFYEILLDVPTTITPTIYIPDAQGSELACVLSFIHLGEAKVMSTNLVKILELCEVLQIKGIMTQEYTVGTIKNGNKLRDESKNRKQQSSVDSDDEFAVEYLECADAEENSSDEVQQETKYEIGSNESFSHFTIEADESEDRDDIEIKLKPKAKRKKKTSVPLARNGNANIDEALSELSKGKTIHQLSIEYNLPRSTLYQKFRSNENLKQNYRSERRLALSQAVTCVMEEQLSLKKASDRYNLPKTAIWRELRKYHQYQPPSKSISQERQRAQNEILAGKSLTSISNKYGIPLTTLHRDKKRLSSEGKLPDFLRVRDRTENSDYGRRLEQALQKCSQGMSQYQAAKMYNIPKATMWRYAHALFKVEGKAMLEDDISNNECD